MVIFHPAAVQGLTLNARDRVESSPALASDYWDAVSGCERDLFLAVRGRVRIAML